MPTTVSAVTTPDLTVAYRAHILEGMLTAGEPLASWLHGGIERARTAMAAALGRHNSEFSLHRVRLLLQGDRSLLGGFCAVAASDLPDCRADDVRALVRSCSRADRHSLTARLRATQSAPLPEDGLCLSRCWIQPGHRNKGYAPDLLQAVADTALNEGLHTIVLQVSIDNAPAVRAYERFGFVPLPDATVLAGPYCYQTMRCQLDAADA